MNPRVWAPPRYRLGCSSSSHYTTACVSLCVTFFRGQRKDGPWRYSAWSPPPRRSMWTNVAVGAQLGVGSLRWSTCSPSQPLDMTTAKLGRGHSFWRLRTVNNSDLLTIVYHYQRLLDFTCALYCETYLWQILSGTGYVIQETPMMLSVQVRLFIMSR